ncbi:hypothetical protein OG474_22965 [Kribbella sp. NBC_01505]|uniref:hypothetical protein n=1 Tax=Kribbella sp. NBC_01505 TaxID=2903580 RepID=UPI00386F067A
MQTAIGILRRWCCPQRAGTAELMSVRAGILLSFQRALWDMVTPSLRAVVVRPEGPVIRARFVYDLVPTEYEREIVSEVETYVISDFDASFDVHFEAEYLPMEIVRVAAPDEWWVYRRLEPDMLSEETE